MRKRTRYILNDIISYAYINAEDRVNKYFEKFHEQNREEFKAEILEEVESYIVNAMGRLWNIKIKE